MLGFVLDFCNTYDLLEGPPDRLSIPLVARHADRSELPPPRLTDDDLERVRAVRNQLYEVFAADSPDAQIGVLNRLSTRTALRRGWWKGHGWRRRVAPMQ